MTPEETVILARYVRAMYPQLKIDEYTPEAWHDALGRYDLEDARTAVVKHVRRGNAFISAGEIAAEVIRIRNKRIGQAAAPYTGVDGAWGQELAALRDHNAAIASGRTTERPALTAGSREALDATKKGVAMLRAVGLGGLSKRPEYAALCPHCAAAPGRPCATGNGRRLDEAHPTRREASRRVLAGERPLGHEDVEREIERRRTAASARLGRLTDDDRARLDEFEQGLRANPGPPKEAAS